MMKRLSPGQSFPLFLQVVRSVKTLGKYTCIYIAGVGHLTYLNWSWSLSLMFTSNSKALGLK